VLLARDGRVGKVAVDAGQDDDAGHVVVLVVLEYGVNVVGPNEMQRGRRLEARGRPCSTMR
jgi:hypothetical protein